MVCSRWIDRIVQEVPLFASTVLMIISIVLSLVQPSQTNMLNMSKIL